MKLKTLLTAAAFFACASTANALEDFTLDESAFEVGGGQFTGDKLNGGYTEYITFDGMGGFSVQAHGTLGQFFANEGVDDITAGMQLGSDYGLYALFDATGTVSAGALPGQVNFNPSGASVSLYVDRDADTTLSGTDGVTPIVVGNSADDDLLASANNLTNGFGTLIPPFGGFFDFTLNDFVLTMVGESYFINPDPFHIIVNVDGDFDNFPAVGTQVITGDFSAVFVSVPEPSTLALFATSLLGLGFATRRRKAAKV